MGETEAEEYLLSELPYQLNCESIEKVELLGDEWVDNDIWHLKKQLYGSTWSDVELTGQEDNIKHFDMSGMTFSGDVTSLAWFFNGYPLLEQIDLPVEQIDNEVDLSGTFKSCPNLTTINHLESFTNISEIEQIFNGSSSLTNVTFCANPTQVHPVSLQYAFSGCTDLQSIKNLEQFTNVTHLRSAFENCVSLDTVKLGDSPFDLADVVTDNPYDHPLYYTFEGANPNMLKYLQDTSTVIPQLWDGRNYDNFVLPFTVNDLTTPISFTPGFPFPAPELGDAITPSYAAHHSGHWEMAPADDPTNFTDIDPSIILDADDNGAKVRYVVTCVKDGLEKYSNEATLHYNTNKRVLLTYDDGTQAIYELYGTGSLELLPQDYKDITSVKCLGENWDNGDLWSLREKIYPSNYEDQQNASIETFDMSEMTLSGDISSGFTWMFDDAIALTSLSFPQSGSGTSSVNLNGMFNNATSLRTINNLDKLENISGLKQTFSECAALDTVTFSSTINPNTFELDMTFTFNGCESLKVVNNLERFENISEIKQMFDDCQLLESVTFSPNDNPSDHVLDMSWLFADCIALESVENFDRFTNVASMHGTFINCSSLDKIFLGIDPSTLVGETYAGRDAASSLFGSDQLTFLKYLPEGVTEVHEDIRWFNNYVVPLELSTVYDHDVQLGTAPNLPSYNHVGPWYAATGSTIWQIQKPGEETWETYTPGTPLNDNDYHGAKLRYKTHSYYDEHFNDTDTVYSNEAIITLWQDLIVETNETKTVDETSPVYRNIYVHHNGNLIVNNAIDIDTLILIPNRDQAYNIFTEKAEYARLRAKSMRIEREVDNNYYYFFSFQENVSIANLIASNPHLGTYGTDWLINEYNEALRSQLGKKDPVWKTIQTNETLRANQGYVVGISETFSKFIYRRDFSSSTAIESTDIKEISTTSTAENNLHAVHKGWNLVAIPDYGKAKYKVDYYENNALVYEDVVVDFPINYGYSGYIQLLSSQIDEFCPGQPFFVQCPGYGKLVFAEIKNAATEISLLSVQTSSIQRSIIKISQNGEVSHDYAILDLNENAPKDEYMIMGDVEDMSYLNASPGVYFFDHGHMLMKNAINPSDYTTVPLHVYVPSAGEYTLHLELSEGLALYDKELDTEVLAQDYTFTATARGKIADRFEFIIPQVVTSNDNNQTIDNDIQILIDNGSILISGTESGEQINIYDANGRLLKQITANDENTTISNIPAGVYVINVAGHSEKLIVK